MEDLSGEWFGNTRGFEDAVYNNLPLFEIDKVQLLNHPGRPQDEFEKSLKTVNRARDKRLKSLRGEAETVNA